MAISFMYDSTRENKKVATWPKETESQSFIGWGDDQPSVWDAPAMTLWL